MVSLVANHRSCLVSRAYWKQAWAKEVMEASVLCWPCMMPAPWKSKMVSRASAPSDAV